MYWRRGLGGRVGCTPAFCLSRVVSRRDGEQARKRRRHQVLRQTYCHRRSRPYHQSQSSCVGWQRAEVTRILAMRRSTGLLAIVGAVLVGTTCQSNAAALNTMDDVGTAIRACWTPPADAGNSTVTLS